MPQKKRRDDLIPTPPIGYRVVWESNDRKVQAPADVLYNDIAYPGVVTVQVNEGNRVRRQENVYWDQHPDTVDRTKHFQHTVREGTWRYVEHDRIPQAHYDLHEKKLEADEEAVVRGQIEAEERQKQMEEFANQPIDARQLEVARVQAQMIYDGAE